MMDQNFHPSLKVLLSIQDRAVHARTHPSRRREDRLRPLRTPSPLYLSKLWRMICQDKGHSYNARRTIQENEITENCDV